MSYQVIARKYRPQRFSDVVGQEHVTRTLANAIEQNRIAHAYLFVGPRGTGKTTIARIFAKCLNCTGGPKAEIDDTDPRCKEITEGRSLDVLEIDGASNRGIEEIRELRETVKYAPAGSKFKIYIIDEVHMLTKEAFNALLKTLEEPPAHVKFMFATTEPEKVLATILSRCQRFDLRRIPAALIVRHLAEIAAKESVEIDEPALHAIARGADGGMRDAESTLDQLISFCGSKIVESDVLSMFGLTSRGQILSIATALISSDSASALRELNSLARQGKDLARLLTDLLGHFRNLLIFRVSGGDLQLLETSESEAETLRQQATLLDTSAATRILEVLTESEGRFRDAASKKIFVEVTLLKAIQARNAITVDAILEQLAALRHNDSETVSPPPASAPPRAARVQPGTPATKSPPASAPAKDPDPTKSALEGFPSGNVSDHATSPAELRESSRPTATGATDLDVLWRDLVAAIGRASPFSRSYFLEAHPVCLQNGTLTVGFDPEFADHLELVDNPRIHALVQTKLGELGFEGSRVKFIRAEQPADKPRPIQDIPASPEPFQKPPACQPAPASEAAPPAATQTAKSRVEPVPFNKEDFKNDPLIQKALEVFRGQIVDVRA